jgi:hypothetical protein
MASTIKPGESRKLVTVNSAAYAKLKAYAKVQGITLTAALNLAMERISESVTAAGG